MLVCAGQSQKRQLATPMAPISTTISCFVDEELESCGCGSEGSGLSPSSSLVVNDGVIDSIDVDVDDGGFGVVRAALVRQRSEICADLDAILQLLCILDPNPTSPPLTLATVVAQHGR